MIPVIDSNVIIDCLCKNYQAAAELKRYQQRYLSIISWIEIMAGAKATPDEYFVRAFLADNFTLVDVNPAIAELATNIRKQYRIKLPDAIIWATAWHHQTLLVTRNSKDFPAENPSVRIPYRV